VADAGRGVEDFSWLRLGEPITLGTVATRSKGATTRMTAAVVDERARRMKSLVMSSGRLG